MVLLFYQATRGHRFLSARLLY